MKKRKVLTFALVLSLLALVVSGTLAYFTDQTGEVQNKFQTGDLSIQLWENKAELNDEGEYEFTGDVPAALETENFWEGNDDLWVAAKGDAEESEELPGNLYAGVLPGMELPKNPTVTVEKGNVECYVLVKVTTEFKTVKALAKALGKHQPADADMAYDVAEAMGTGFDPEKWELVDFDPKSANDLADDDEVTFIIGLKETVKPDAENNQSFEIMNKIVVPEEWEADTMKALNEATLTFQAFAIQAYKVADLQAAAEALELVEGD